MISSSAQLRDGPAPPMGGETVRAFVVFAVLFLTLTAIAGHLSLRELDLQALMRRTDLGQDEAERIADAVTALGLTRGGIDYQRLRENVPVLETIINERLWARSFVRHVEVRDRSGARMIFLTREASGDPGFSSSNDLAEGGEQVVTAQLRRAGTMPEGEVRLGIEENAFRREFAELQRSLRMKVVAAASFGLAVLAVGFLYVLHLIRKNRRLEQEKIKVERQAFAGFLASGLAHEIRNPLNAMNMNLQMLEEELQGIPGIQEGSDYGELLGSTKSEIKRLERLVNNFLAYARPTDPRLESRDVNELLRQVVRFFQADFTRGQVELSLDLEPLLPTVELDETLLKQALTNLLVNARQVLRPGGRVVLRTRAGGDGSVWIEVQDNGPGIPAEAREKVFEVFYSSRGGGTGLGLPIARRIVEKHQGTIELESPEDGGTLFRIRLPRRHGRMGTAATATQVAS